MAPHLIFFVSEGEIQMLLQERDELDIEFRPKGIHAFEVENCECSPTRILTFRKRCLILL
jgi:hypothetical protein